jgi:rubredoxin---NAD+ reductase
MNGAPVVVLGAGLAGWTVVRELRKLDTTTPIVVITADSGDFYAKPSLSNAFAQKKSPAQLVTTPAAKMVETLNVTLLPFTRVEHIDTAARTVRTATGDMAYRDLVLALGALPIRVPLAGNAADRVLSVNSLDDFAAFHARLPAQARVLVMGAGLIGCEFANDLAGAGHTVRVVDPAARPLAALLPEAASLQLQSALSALGVQWHFGTTVARVDAAGDVFTATLSDGTTDDADVVLSAIGLRADTALARAAGIACDRGIVVNTRLATSAPHVHALGDCAQYASAAGQTLRGYSAPGMTLPYVMPIMNAARALAATLAGTPTALVFPLMPVAVKTPALPLVIAPPAPGSAGQWAEAEPGLWQFVDPAKVQRGFVLAGTATARRAEQVKLVTP